MTFCGSNKNLADHERTLLELTKLYRDKYREGGNYVISRPQGHAASEGFI